MSSDEEGETEEAIPFGSLELDIASSENGQDLNIGPLQCEGAVYTHEGANYVISVQDEPEKVTSPICSFIYHQLSWHCADELGSREEVGTCRASAFKFGPRRSH